MAKIALPKHCSTKCRISGETGVFWTLPPWARKRAASGDSCPVEPEALGTLESKGVDAVTKRAAFLNQVLDAWRTGKEPPRFEPGSIDELVAWFREHPKVKRKGDKTQQSYQDGAKLLRDHLDDKGRRVGSHQVRAVEPRHVDLLYERLQWVDAGNGTKRRRLATANAAMRACRRMWSLAVRAGMADANPFAKMDLEAPLSGTVAATREQVEAFALQADAMGHPSMALAAYLTFEFIQRQVDVLGRLSWTNYKPGKRLTVVHHKTHKEVRVPLYDDAGACLFPETVARLEAAPRRGALIVMRDSPDKRRSKTEGEPIYLPYQQSWFEHLFRKIAVAAGLPSTFNFLGCRTGGMTELGDSEATDSEITAISSRTRATISIYTRRTSRQAMNAAKKRRALRTKLGQKSE